MNDSPEIFITSTTNLDKNNLLFESNPSFSITYVAEDAVVFYEVQNVNDEPTRLYARYKEMLFLSQDHGPIHRLGFRYKF